MIDRKKLIEAYSKYGFIEQKSESVDIVVFSIKTGHYHNADIIPLKKGIDVNCVFNQYKEQGYACQIKEYESNEDAHKALFNGFFSIDHTKERLTKEYETFTDAIVKIHSDDAKYSFIQSQYHINEKIGESTLIDEISKRLEIKKPILFLIEAAAGFGKTCSAYELLNYIVSNNANRVPLFSELSRNRQAKIFRYVLLDEIDRSFPLLSSSLVRNEITNGNVPVILDGFDELLHESACDENQSYDKTEPMLETISELLVNNAKIVLTTRRTAIFDGDEFHQWIISHESDFEVVRIRIHEPRVEDWLPEERLKSITESGFPIQNISNPVLLSFLRCISDEQFNTVKSDPSKLVEKYFKSMFEREQKRQDLIMTPDEQSLILKQLAGDMIELNYTSESRDYICSLILEKNLSKLESVRKLYDADKRPTTDELVNKLASHALLDRASNESQGIGFINEFVLGSFCASNIINDNSGEWVGDRRFIEPAVQSYLSRTEEERFLLWHSLEFALEFMNGSDKVLFNQILLKNIQMDLDGDSVERSNIFDIKLGDTHIIKDTNFIDCKLSNCILNFDKMENVTFVNTSFFNCKFIINRDISDIYFLACDADNNLLDHLDLNEITEPLEDELTFSNSDIYILEKFWPKGSSSLQKHRAIKMICAMTNQFSQREILLSIKKLKRDNILITPDKRSFLELNIKYITEVKSALGRD